jgi:hypothetical protein
MAGWTEIGDRVFVGGLDGVLYLLELETGKVLYAPWYEAESA